MVRCFLALILAVGLSGRLAAQVPVDPLSPHLAVRILVPAYIFPSLDPATPEGLEKWDVLIKSASEECPVVAILNPANGPVDRTDPRGEPWRLKCYSALLRDAQKRNPHLRFVMYVPLAREKKTAGNRDWAVQNSARDDIDTWMKTYPRKDFPNLIGFFFDEHPAFDAAQIALAGAVRTYAARQFPNALIFLNVGQSTEVKILDRKNSNEVALLWEKPASADVRTFKLPAWAEPFPRRQFAAIVHTQPTLPDDSVAGLNNAPPIGKRLGWVYVTDRKPAWTELPSYWPALVAQVKKQNVAK